MMLIMTTNLKKICEYIYFLTLTKNDKWKRFSTVLENECGLMTNSNKQTGYTSSPATKHKLSEY